MRAKLLRAYEAALYAVQLDSGELILHVGQPLPAELDAWFDARGIESAAFISAANPRSRPMTTEENARRHEQLLNELHVLDVSWLPGYGRDPAGVWEAEQSVLALRLTRAQAMRVAVRFEQNAFLDVLPHSPPTLVLTPHWASSER